MHLPTTTTTTLQLSLSLLLLPLLTTSIPIVPDQTPSPAKTLAFTTPLKPLTPSFSANIARGINVTDDDASLYNVHATPTTDAYKIVCKFVRPTYPKYPTLAVQSRQPWGSWGTDTAPKREEGEGREGKVETFEWKDVEFSLEEAVRKAGWKKGGWGRKWVGVEVRKEGGKVRWRFELEGGGEVVVGDGE